MKILVVGAGGREHALSWKISQSPLATKVFVAPGNGGTELETLITNVDIQANDIEGLAEFALEEKIDLTIIGPEDPLVNGITDRFNQIGLKCFGPSKSAAQLEGSKEFMKKFLKRHHIPTASYATFNDSNEAKKYVKEKGCPIVIKADGLAAGKGVTIAHSIEEAEDAINQSLESKVFGEAGNTIVIEEFLTGEEASFIVITDGNTAIPFASSQDHKARDDKDKGPNTGGMGAYSPSRLESKKLEKKIIEKIIEPTLKGLKDINTKFKGFLYVGLMILDDEPFLIEYNVRMGDPECQAVLPRLKTDFLDIVVATVNGNLKNINLEWFEEKSICVVLASKGYPDEYENNLEIKGLKKIKLQNNEYIFHAGTKIDNLEIYSNGGRVLNFVIKSNDLRIGRDQAISLINKLNWKNGYFRKDIGYKIIP